MARDNFVAKLRCPVCEREGTAKLSQEDGYRFVFGDQSTTIEFVPEGFRFVSEKSSIASDVDFQCLDHPVSAVQ